MKTSPHTDIFIVDDNRTYALALKACIESAFRSVQIKIHLFENGEAFIQKYSTVLPDLVILDICLNSPSPDPVDGLDLLEIVKRTSSKTSVIMLTGNLELATALQSFHNGASDYVVKTEDQFDKINASISKILAAKSYEIEAEKKIARGNVKRAAELHHSYSKRLQAERSALLNEERNRDITDSINYASRIQRAKLPNQQEIDSALANCFVLFKPKDIVSGDFYHFNKSNFGLFIAAADCTGHGVPGAFMSMLCSVKIDEALSLSSDTSEILRYVNKGIKDSLHQSQHLESTKDGMDIAICSIDAHKRVVEYAGANRPLWLIRSGSNRVEEVKATKSSIGGFTEDDQRFEKHVLQLNAGDTFYISTDGYADQFGGNDGKKLMSKRFKEILVGIQDKSMESQRVHLDDFVENWRAGEEQVDDILVIGVRL